MRAILLSFSITLLSMSVDSIADGEGDGEGDGEDKESTEDESVVNYHTREEKREAAVGTQLSPWLKVSAFLESEIIANTAKFAGDRGHQREDTIDPSVQLAFELIPREDTELEIVLEYTEDNSDPLLDELIISQELGSWGFSLGRYYPPFGNFYSHFVTGPLLEFAETRADTLQVDYDFADKLQLSAYVFDGKTRHQGDRRRFEDWGISSELELYDGSLNMGWSYISNLAAADFRPLADFADSYQRRVGAWNAYAVVARAHWGASLEIVRASRAFKELDRKENKPSAWNIEWAYYPYENLEFAVRIEGSRELMQEPRRQYGLTVTWRALKQLSLSIDYLKYRYPSDFYLEDDDQALIDGDLIVARLALEF